MINSLVCELPEVYQPIYGHPEVSVRVSRPCIDRLAHIISIHNALQRLLGRPLKVLDLGCAQGFFCFHLAERGAIVHGVDYLDKNIAVCNELAKEYSALQVDFEVGWVEEVISRLEAGQYDLMLGLSVFHHILYEKGVDAVREMLKYAATRIGVLVVELALREEPPYWAQSQPEDPRTVLEDIAFVHEIVRHGTHLAPIPRPLFVTSNEYWIFDDQAGRFDAWRSESHVLANGVYQRSRRYYFSKDHVIKLYRFDSPLGAVNKTDFSNEIRFLMNPPPSYSIPTVITHGYHETEAWLVMQRLPGRLLLDVLREGLSVDCRAILGAVLKQLTVLENAGLYHNDVRTWNIILTQDGSLSLLDYGSISSKKIDCTWPSNPFLSFLIFVREVITGLVDNPNPLRTISISPYGLPQPYLTWVTNFWRLPSHQWSFKIMHQMLMDMPNEIHEDLILNPNDEWMKAIEEAMQSQKLFASHISQIVNDEILKRHTDYVEFYAKQADIRATQAEVREAEARAQVQHALTVMQQAHGFAEQAEARANQAEERATQAETRATEAEAQATEARDQVQHAQTEMQQAQVQAQQAKARANGLAAELADLSTQLARTQEELHQVHQANHHHWQQLEATRQELHNVHQANHHHWQLATNRQEQLEEILGSTSIRLTAPLRWLGKQVRVLARGGLILRPKYLLQHSGRFVEGRPRLKRIALKVLQRHPELKQRLKSVVAVPVVGINQPVLNTNHCLPTRPMAEADLAHLTPRARQIFIDLKAAIAQQN